MSSSLWAEDAANSERMAQEILHNINRDILDFLMTETLSEQIKIEQERVKQESTVGKKLSDFL